LPALKKVLEEGDDAVRGYAAWAIGRIRGEDAADILNSRVDEEKDEIFKQLWLEKEKSTMKVLPEEMLALYENKKAQILTQNPQAKIPSYISLGTRLKNEILEQKIMANITKDMNITIYYDSNTSSETKE